MDNLVFEKIWQEGNLLELKMTANCDYVKACQSCYISTENLDILVDKIINFVKEPKVQCYLEFGNKEGNFTPAFSMLILPIDNYGHLKIEVDIEIADNDTRCHRCSFYVNSEIGLVERLGNRLRDFVTCSEGERISLVEM